MQRFCTGLGHSVFAFSSFFSQIPYDYNDIHNRYTRLLLDPDLCGNDCECVCLLSASVRCDCQLSPASHACKFETDCGMLHQNLRRVASLC